MTYKLHANFVTVQSFQASSWKEKDGLHVMKQYPQDLMSETDSDCLLSIWRSEICTDGGEVQERNCGVRAPKALAE